MGVWVEAGRLPAAVEPQVRLVNMAERGHQLPEVTGSHMQGTGGEPSPTGIRVVLQEVTLSRGQERSPDGDTWSRRPSRSNADLGLELLQSPTGLLQEAADVPAGRPAGSRDPSEGEEAAAADHLKYWDQSLGPVRSLETFLGERRRKPDTTSSCGHTCCVRARGPAWA